MNVRERPISSIEYKIRWLDEDKSGQEYRRRIRMFNTKPWRKLLKELLEERGEYLMKASDFEVDLRLAFFDTKREMNY